MVVSWRAMQRSDAPRSVIRSTLTLGSDEELDTQPTASPLALSPDGRRLAYVARSSGHHQLYVRNLDAFDAKLLPGTEGAQYPFFSPDGEAIAFFAGGKLKRVSIVSGSPAIVCDVPAITRGGSWSSQGFIVVPDPGGTGLMKVPESGGVPERVAINNADIEKLYLAWPHFLPDGRRLLVSIGTDPPSSATNRIAILSMETGEWTPLGARLPGAIHRLRPYRCFMRRTCARENSTQLSLISQRELRAAFPPRCWRECFDLKAPAAPILPRRRVR